MTQPIENEFAAGQILLLSADDQNHAFDLWETFRVALGRHHSNDVPLASRKVSNYHAEILNEGDGWLLRDLGSTNGTYVNDEKIHHRRLKDGDRIRIGGYELRVSIQVRDQAAGKGSGLLPVGTKGQFAASRGPAPHGASTGTEARKREPSLADLLRVLTNGKGARLLSLRNHHSEDGRVYVDGGRIVHAELGELRAVKALYRMFRWSGGAFEIAAYPETLVPRSIELPTDALISEGLKNAELMEKISQLLPPFVVPLKLKEDCPLPLRALSPAEITIFQGVIRYETLAELLDKSPMTDLRILELVRDLLQKKVFTISEGSGSLLEETFIYRPQ